MLGAANNKGKLGTMWLVGAERRTTRKRAWCDGGVGRQRQVEVGESSANNRNIKKDKRAGMVRWEGDNTKVGHGGVGRYDEVEGEQQQQQKAGIEGQARHDKTESNTKKARHGG